MGSDDLREKNFLELQKYVGKVVAVKGLFVGWQVGGCIFPTQAADEPLTRSDWIIRSGEVCVYVTGGFPEGASPFNHTNVGRSVEVEAEVLETKSGKIYLKFRKGKIE